MFAVLAIQFRDLHSRKINMGEAMGELKEKREYDSQHGSISIASVFNSINRLDAEEQMMILSNYKIGELYKLYSNEEEFHKYLKSLEDTAKLYTKTADALMKHRKEAVAEGGVKWESEMVRTMEEAYDNMTEWGQEKFCREMSERAGFFIRMYKMVMEKLGNALREQKRDAENACRN